MRSTSAAPDLVAGLKAARVSLVPLLSCSMYRLVSSCDTHDLLGWGLKGWEGGKGEGDGGGGGGAHFQRQQDKQSATRLQPQ